MNIVAIVVLTTFAASLTIGLLHLRLCFVGTERMVNRLFVAAAFSLSIYAFCEYLLMMAETPAEYGLILRWGHLAAWVVPISICWFVLVYLQTGRIWLLWAVVALRTLTLLVNFASPLNINYREIHSIEHVNFLGESVSVAVGTPNPWMLLGNTSLVIFMIFCIDAAISLWRRGERQRAFTIGVSACLFSAATAFFAISVLWGLIPLPLMASPFFLGIVFSMGYEMTRNIQLSSELAADLAKSQAALAASRDQLVRTTEAGKIGVWERDIVSGTTWGSYKAHELFELEAGQSFSTEDVQSKLHPDDLDNARKALQAAYDGNGDYVSEYRIVLKNGETRWIRSQGTVEFDEGKPKWIRGALADVTRRKLAELALKEAMTQVEQLRDELKQENIYLKSEIELEHNFHEIIGKSDEIKYTLFKVEQVAPTDATVLILGETGTGKELVARAIHKASPRSGRALVRINCAALPANLIESELFGHERGAFTGASVQKAGRFEIADGATLFLDEIGELPLELQSKLLRVLQDGEFERLGSNRTKKVNVRVIAATNRNLHTEIKKGTFREDLWYRLNVFPINVPPLRQRRGDVPLLVNYFVDKYNRKMGREVTNISAAVLRALEEYSWPGNVRELENVIERAVISGHDSSLLLVDRLIEVNRLNEGSDAGSLLDVERTHIMQILESAGWKIGGDRGAASRLGMNPSTLRSRMAKLKIHRPA